MALPAAGTYYKYIDNTDVDTNITYPYRIVAERDFLDVVTGDEGGLVGSDTCLIQTNTTWLEYNCKIEDGSVLKNGHVKGNVTITNNSTITIYNKIIDGDIDISNSAITNASITTLFKCSIIDSTIYGTILTSTEGIDISSSQLSGCKINNCNIYSSACTGNINTIIDNCDINNSKTSYGHFTNVLLENALLSQGFIDCPSRVAPDGTISMYKSNYGISTDAYHHIEITGYCNIDNLSTVRSTIKVNNENDEVTNMKIGVGSSCICYNPIIGCDIILNTGTRCYLNGNTENTTIIDNGDSNIFTVSNSTGSSFIINSSNSTIYLSSYSSSINSVVTINKDNFRLSITSSVIIGDITIPADYTETSKTYTGTMVYDELPLFPDGIKYRYTPSGNSLYPYRIVALKDFGTVVTGDEGGLVQYKDSLSQEGNCWIGYDCTLTIYSKVVDNAFVDITCDINGNSIISGDAVIIRDSNAYNRKSTISTAIINDSCEINIKSSTAVLYSSLLTATDTIINLYSNTSITTCNISNSIITNNNVLNISSSTLTDTTIDTYETCTINNSTLICSVKSIVNADRIYISACKIIEDTIVSIEGVGKSLYLTNGILEIDIIIYEDTPSVKYAFFTIEKDFDIPVTVGDKYVLTQNIHTSTRAKYPYTIKALKDFGTVVTGDEGGLVANVSCLSQEGDCWLGDLSYMDATSTVKDNICIGTNITITNSSISGEGNISMSQASTITSSTILDMNATGTYINISLSNIENLQYANGLPHYRTAIISSNIVDMDIVTSGTTTDYSTVSLYYLNASYGPNTIQTHPFYSVLNVNGNAGGNIWGGGVDIVIEKSRGYINLVNVKLYEDITLLEDEDNIRYSYVTIPTPTADLEVTIDSINVSGTGVAGDVITYNIKVGSIGSLDVTNVLVVDDIVTVIGGPIDMSFGTYNNTEFVGTYTITDTDVANGYSSINPNVTGLDPDNGVISRYIDTIYKVIITTPPITNIDTLECSINNSVTFDILANDTDNDNDIDITTVSLIPMSGTIVTSEEDISGNGIIDKLIVDDDGTWSVTNGLLTYTPIHNKDTQTSIIYNVKDNTGKISNNSIVTVNISASLTNPTTLSDTYTVDSLPIHADTIVIDILDNDSDVEDNITTNSIDIVHVNATVVNTDYGYRGRLYIPNEGLWLVDYSTMQLTFTPDNGFTKDPTPIEYRVTDTTGLVSNTSTVNIDYVNKAITVDDVLIDNVIEPTTINILDNDIFDNDINKDSLTIVGDYTDVNGSLNTEGTQLTIPDVAVWTVNRIDGNILCTPINDYVGETHIEYKIYDMESTVSNISNASITFIVTNDPITQTDLVTIGTPPDYNTPVTIDVLANDTDLDDNINIDSISIVGGVDTNSNGYNNYLLVSNEGTWSVVSGKIQFVPLTTFYGDPTPIEYTIEDNTHIQSNTSTVNIDYLQRNPIVENISVVGGVVDNEVTIDVRPHVSDVDGNIRLNSISFIHVDAVSYNNTPYKNKLVVENEGTWTALTSGIVVFTPLHSFYGDPSNITYTIQDTTDLTSNEAVISCDYTQASDIELYCTLDDTSVIELGETLNFSFRIYNKGSLDLTNIHVENDKISVDNNIIGLMEPRQENTSIKGTYVITEDDYINKGFTVISTVYCDATDGTIITSESASLFISLNSKPVTVGDAIDTNIIEPVSIDVTINDSDLQNDIDNSTVELSIGITAISEDITGNGRIDKLTVPNEGVWTVTNGVVTFTPVDGLLFNPTNITYTIKDVFGLESSNAYVTIDYNIIGGIEISYDENISNYGQVGDTITYTLSVINVGNILVNNITCKDSLDNNISSDQDGKYNYTYTITQSDMVSRRNNITLTFNGTAEDGSIVQKNVYINTDLVLQTPPRTTNASTVVGTGATVPNVYLTSFIQDDESNTNLDKVNLIGTHLQNATPEDTTGNGYNDKLTVPNEGVWVANNGIVTFTPDSTLDTDTTNPLPIKYTIEDDTELTSNESYISVQYGVATELSIVDTIAITGKGQIGDKIIYTPTVIKNGNDTLYDIITTYDNAVQDVDENNNVIFVHTITEEDMSATRVLCTGNITGHDYVGMIYTDHTTVHNTHVEIIINVPPVAVLDSIQYANDGVVHINVLLNDSDADGNLSPDKINLSCPSYDTSVPEDTTGNGYNDKLTVPNEGVWVANNGIVTFTPYAGFTTDPTSILYNISDDEDLTSGNVPLSISYSSNIDISISDSYIVTGNGLPGDTIIYKPVVTITGDVDINTISLDYDNAIVNRDTTVDESDLIFDVTYTITEQDMISGTVICQGRVSAVTSTNMVISDYVRTPASVGVPLAKIGLIRLNDLPQYYYPGDTVKFFTNVDPVSGPIEVTDITVSDTKGSPVEVSPLYYMTEHIITQADVDEGYITSVFTAKGKGVNGATVTAISQEKVKITVVPRSIELIADKYISNYGQVGDVIQCKTIMRVVGIINVDTINITCNGNPTTTRTADDRIYYDYAHTVTESDMLYGSVTITFNCTVTDINGVKYTAEKTMVEILHVVIPAIALVTETRYNGVGPAVTDIASRVVLPPGYNVNPESIDITNGEDTTGNGYNDKLTVPNEGTWVANNGKITFTPLETLRVQPSAAQYTIKTTDGITSNHVYVKTIFDFDYLGVIPPVMQNHTHQFVGLKDVEYNFTLDTINVDSRTDTDSGNIVNGEDTTGNGYNDTLVVPNEGTWRITGPTLTFKPNTDFYSNPTPIDITVRSVAGLESNPARITILYIYEPPKTTNDYETVVGTDIEVSLDLLANDTDGNDDMDPSTVKVIQVYNDYATIATDGKSVNIPNMGNYVIQEDGVAKFTPAPGFYGTTSLVGYTVEDKGGAVSNESIFSITYQHQLINIHTDVSSKMLDTTDGLAPGDRLEYTVNLSNSGNIELYDCNYTVDGIDVTDGVLGDLDLNGAVKRVFQYNITAEDIIKGSKSTTITITGKNSDDEDFTYTTPNITVYISSHAPNTTDKFITSRGDNKDVVFAYNTIMSDTDGDIDKTTIVFKQGNTYVSGSVYIEGEGTWSVDVSTGDITFSPLITFKGITTPMLFKVSDFTGNESDPAILKILFTTSTVTGIVFNDVDGDGVFTIGKDAGIPNIGITIEYNDGSKYSTVTDDGGNYTFNNIGAGAIELKIVDDDASYGGVRLKDGRITAGAKVLNTIIVDGINTIASTGYDLDLTVHAPNIQYSPRVNKPFSIDLKEYIEDDVVIPDILLSGDDKTYSDKVIVTNVGEWSITEGVLYFTLYEDSTYYELDNIYYKVSDTSGNKDIGSIEIIPIVIDKLNTPSGGTKYNYIVNGTPDKDEYNKYPLRIQYNIDIGNMKRGDIGGRVGFTDLLSQDGNCWIGPDVFLDDSSTVTGNAYVDGKVILNKSNIRDDVKVYSNETCTINDSNIIDNVEVNNYKLVDKMRITDNVKLKSFDAGIKPSIVNKSSVIKTISGDANISGPVNITYTGDISNVSLGKDALIINSSTMEFRNIILKDSGKLTLTEHGKIEGPGTINMSGKMTIRNDSIISTHGTINMSDLNSIISMSNRSIIDNAVNINIVNSTLTLSDDSSILNNSKLYVNDLSRVTIRDSSTVNGLAVIRTSDTSELILNDTSSLSGTSNIITSNDSIVELYNNAKLIESGTILSNTGITLMYDNSIVSDHGVISNSVTLLDDSNIHGTCVINGSTYRRVIKGGISKYKYPPYIVYDKSKPDHIMLECDKIKISDIIDNYDIITPSSFIKGTQDYIDRRNVINTLLVRLGKPTIR